MSDSLQPVHGILQARTLEWVAIPFSRGSSQLGIEPRSPALQADSLQLSYQGHPINKKSLLKFKIYILKFTKILIN